MFTKPLCSSLLLVPCIFFPLTLAENAGDLCKRIRGNVGHKQLLCVGKMRKTLLIITQDLYVYQIQMTSLNGTIDKLYLGNYEPKAIKELWPKLWKNTHFQGLVKDRSRLLDVYTCVDKIDEYVIFETTGANQKQYSTLYGINHQYVNLGTGYNPSDRTLSLLSSDNMKDYYQLTKNPDDFKGNMTIMRWHFLGDSIKDLKFGHTAHYYDKPFYRMCTEGSSKIFILKDPNGECHSIGWPVLTGFLANKQFYLFGEAYIFSFPESAYTKPGFSVGLKKIPYGSFIQCDGSASARELSVSKKSPVSFGLIVAIILILLLLILCCLLCLMREALARRKKKGKKDDSSSWNLMSLAMSDRKAVPGTNRSNGLPVFGSLSKKLSGGKTKRSKGGASTVKSLSKKGSKRSGGIPSKGRPISHKATAGTKRSAGGVDSGNSISGKKSAKKSANNNPTDRSGHKGRAHRGSGHKKSDKATRSRQDTRRSKMRK